MKCLLLINISSGNSSRVTQNDDVINTLKEKFDIVDKVIISEENTVDIKSRCCGYDALAVCGGDGTFNSALNATRDLDIQLIYIPCGTLNDTAKTHRITAELEKSSANKKIRRIDLGEINDQLFSYVAATGTFTPIGYIAKAKQKKTYKRFAYFYLAFKEYKVWRIKAKVTADGKVFQDTYTLIMAVKSRCCFGFNFNKMYSHNSGTAHLLLIKAPKFKGFVGAVSMFFSFFRAFFIGFKKPRDTKYIKFLEFKNATIELEQEFPFCLDGEKYLAPKYNTVVIHKQKTNLFV